MENFTKDTPFEEVLASIEPLIGYISRGTNSVYDIDREDLEQELRIQALLSWQTWIPGRGANYFTYVRNAMIKKKNFLVRTAKAQCRNGGQRPHSLDEIRACWQSFKSQNGSFRAVSTAEDDCNPEAHFFRQEIRDAIEEVLGSMDERPREIIEYILDGYNQVETAKIIGVSQPTVNYHVKQFRKKLRQALERRGLGRLFDDK